MKDWNPSSRKHIYRPVWSLPMIQRRTGWKCCGQMRPKSSFLASTQLTVFGGGGMTPRTPSPLSNMEVETLCFGAVFLLRGQNNCTASKGRWTGPCSVRARALKMGRGWVPSSMKMTQKHTVKATKEWLKRKYIKGIKMKIVIIYSPSSSSKPVWIYLFCRTQRKIFWRKFVTRLFWGTIDFHSRKTNPMDVNGAPELLCFPHSSEYLPLCSAEQIHAYRFGTTWGWVNDDIIFIFVWTIPLRSWSGLASLQTLIP